MRIWTDYDKFKAVAEVMMILLAQHKEGGCCDEVLPIGLCAVPISEEIKEGGEGKITKGLRIPEAKAEPKLDP